MKKKDNATSPKEGLVSHIKRNKITFTVYVILRLIVIISMIFAAIRGNYENVGTCVLTLVLLLVPSFAEKQLKIELPTLLETVIMCFIFAHTILGELSGFYVKVPWWDTMLHTLNGFICAGVGLSLIDLLNRHKRFKFELSPIYVTVVAFCFSMTVGVLWEFFEFGMDMFFNTDMQKDTVIHAINSVSLDPTKSNTVVTVKDITSVYVNGNELGLGGYLDIGLIDTMKDLLVNFIGAVTFSVGGFFYIKNRGKKNRRFVEGFLPTPAADGEKAFAENATEEDKND